ncbi:hypothetical protein MSG28_003912 [Choristoneura fumiferana]|uniref:Uncharacterized protein n=1 Tax=Choristoneura fumiferana TaxID=7141 RepID=A0ACC0KHP9_CHOFU|nr:hypothetical protein MSG28_003912 [Choristoneura fumiferana]
MATDSTNEPGAANEELPGLAPLGRLDQVMVKQQIEIAELALGVERRNRYRIMDTNEDIIYYAIEDTELTNRVLFGSYRSFKLPIFTEDRTQLNLNKEEVGVISKKWGGLAREYVTDADYFSISYSENFDTKTKAILLGALFLIVSRKALLKWVMPDPSSK